MWRLLLGVYMCASVVVCGFELGTVYMCPCLKQHTGCNKVLTCLVTGQINPGWKKVVKFDDYFRYTIKGWSKRNQKQSQSLSFFFAGWQRKHLISACFELCEWIPSLSFDLRWICLMEKFKNLKLSHSTVCRSFSIYRRIFFHSSQHLIKIHWQGLCFSSASPS